MSKDSKNPKAQAPNLRDTEVDHSMSLARRDPRERDESRDDGVLKLSILWRLFKYTRKYPEWRKWLFILVIVRGLQGPALTWMMGTIISNPIEKMTGLPAGAASYGPLFWWVFGFFLLALFIDVTFYFRSRIGSELDEAMVRDIRNEVFRHLMRQTMGFYNRTRVGRIISRMTSDVEALRRGVQMVFFVSLVQFGNMLGAGVLLVITNWVLFLIICIMGPVLYIMDRYFRMRISRASRNVQESFSRVTGTIAESVKGMRVTQGFVREDKNAEMFDHLSDDHADFNIKLARESAFFIPLLELNTQVMMAVILIVGGWGVLNAGWSVGDLITFFFLANLFFNPLKAIGRQFTMAISAMAGGERVFRLLDTPPEWIDTEDCEDLPRIDGRVAFEDLRFSYDGRTEVLHGINFVAEPGQTVALVGHTGSGKSTIINLLSKFHLPTDGRILIDGYDITRIKTPSLRKQLGIVLQRNFLFAGDVMDNIRLGKPGATDEEVVATVERLGCRDLIEAMPGGFHAAVAENGVGLSLGQQQVVCFARALLADPRILILDEATSSIDTITEARLQKALETLLSGRTCFIVAHRLSTIRKADQVLVLDHGHIVERGNHRELLRAGGIYSNLYQQFAA